MKIYIIEDSHIKIERIIEFIKIEFPNFSEPSVFLSFNSGLHAVKNDPPDLVILDMTLPTFDRKPNDREGRLRPLGGFDLMRKMKLKGVLSKVIIVTQLEAFGEGDEKVSFSDLSSICSSGFPDLYLGKVYFDQSGTLWKNELKKIMHEELKRVKSAKNISS